MELAKGMRRPLLIVHVTSPVTRITGDTWFAPRRVRDDVQRWIERVARDDLDRLLRHARAAGLHVSGTLRDGVVSEQIVKVARAQHAEMIVMGTHGHTGLSRMLLGSVAARVLPAAPCPVMSDVLHHGHGTLTHERDGNWMGAHALARDAASRVGGADES